MEWRFVLSFHAAASRAESKTAEVQVDWKGSQYLSLEGYTVSNPGQPRATPGDSRRQGKISLEGYTPAKMAAEAALSWHQFTPARHFSV